MSAAAGAALSARPCSPASWLDVRTACDPGEGPPGLQGKRNGSPRSSHLDSGLDTAQ